MELEEKKVGKVLIVIPRQSRIDASVSTEFKGRMVDSINQGNKLIVLDLSDVDFVDSSGLGVMVSSLKTIDNEGDLVICCIRDTVMRLFSLTRMNRVFSIFTTQADALQALNEKYA
jgi:anti-sigma B factor antagonist